MDKSIELGTGGVAEWILPFHDLHAGRMMRSSDCGIRFLPAWLFGQVATSQIT
jgi:hypothetical protein